MSQPVRQVNDPLGVPDAVSHVTPSEGLAALAMVRGLRTLVQSGVLDVLEGFGPASTTDLAARAHVSIEPLELLLNGLAEGGVVYRDRVGQWRLAGTALAWKAALNADTKVFHHVLEGASPPVEVATDHEGDIVELIGGVGEPVMTALAQRLASPRQSVLDLAAGDAAWSRALLRVEPTMRATVVDRPAVIAALADRRPAFAADDRVTLVPGDVDRVRIDARFDLVTLSSWCQLHDDEANQQLFRRVANWLEPGGTAVVVDAVRDARARPGLALHELSLAYKSSAGRVHRLDAYRRWMHSVGLSHPELIETGLASQVVLISRAHSTTPTTKTKLDPVRKANQ